MDTESKIVSPMVTIRVNGQDIEVAEGEILLKVLLSADVRLPALCFHPALKRTTGVCRLCTVEISLPGEGAGGPNAPAWSKRHRGWPCRRRAWPSRPRARRPCAPC